MYKSAVKYRNTWLCPGTRGLDMYNANKFKELDQHLKDLEKKEQKLQEGNA